MVEIYLEKMNFKETTFQGCAYGMMSRKSYNRKNPKVRDDKGRRCLVLKTWKLAVHSETNDIREAMNKMCPGGHDHARCQGKETKGTENYSWEIVSDVHRAFKSQCDKSKGESASR